MPHPCTIIGGGLAGCEAAWQAVKLGVSVFLYEMKPQRFSPAHVSPLLGELVCSNSLRSNSLANAVGLLKEEMRQLGSLTMAVADETRVPAGDALAVDRQAFAARITSRLQSLAKIKIIREEIREIPAGGIVIVASGPLTSPPLVESMKQLIGEKTLYFYDAIAPIVDGDGLNMNIIFRASRYGRGDDYLNCPLTREEYYRFVGELGQGEKVPYREFEKPVHFEGCLPIEEIAGRGRETLAYGPMKPVGLRDPRTGKIPYAVVQLRQENEQGTAFNLVGFQTKLKWKEQERIFRMLPGLEQAVFLRFGSLHRNTFIHAPALLQRTLQLKKDERIFFAGQITGVEGYVESSAMGLLAGINAALYLQGKSLLFPPQTTAMGSLIHYLSNPLVQEFQPMNVNFGLFPPLDRRLRGKEKHKALAERALKDLQEWAKDIL
ncbi:MAG: methylenetetrahydrofolate--tRNA-(uracil(54)-C(5))-methyltransferase (FADH(2)-oxidizing) TrmFO [Pseudomonadota bacterium]